MGRNQKETMTLKELALQRINGKPEGKPCGNRQETFTTQKFPKVSNHKVVLLVLGYKCDCGSISYKQNAFRWQDFKGRSLPGFICCGCGTRYKFV